MGRGKLLRTKIRARKALVKADLQAKKEWEERKSNFLYHAKKQILGLLKSIDPLEMMAVAGTTFIIHDTIVASQEVLDALLKIPAAVSNWVIEWGTALSDWLNSIWGFSPPRPPAQDAPAEEKQKFNLDWKSWVLSFVLAFLMVRHAEGIIRGLTSVSSLALGLLG